METESAAKDTSSVNVFGERSSRDWLIVMDDVSDLTDASEKFSSFLTVAWKINYNCVYSFHIIYSKKRFGDQLFHKQILLI